MPKPSWRQIEAALIDYFRKDNWYIDQDPKTGDKALDSDDTYINLTDLAKHLEDRL